MATIATSTNGHRRIQFRHPVTGKRPTVRLGKMSQRNAEKIRSHIEELIAAQRGGGHCKESTARWLAEECPLELRKRIAAAQLIEEPEAATLAAFIDKHIESREAMLAERTLSRLKQSRKAVVRFFGEDKPLREVTEGDAKDFRAKMLADGYAEATTRKTCGDARFWFKYAVEKRLILRNPFDAVPCSAVANTSRQHYIAEADALAVLEQLPSAQWRVLFALARWGGLRTPSEPRLLTWADVDFGDAERAGRITVTSPKTAHHAGHESRIIPLFPELAGPLREAFELAEPGEPLVIPMLQGKQGASLRKPVEQAIKRAGLKPWPKLWHNLRATRQTELEQRHPSHVVCSWIGNSESIARKHYLQVTDADFQRAATGGAKAAQKAAQYTHASGHIEAQAADQPTHVRNAQPIVRNEKAAINAAFSGSLGTVSIPPRGVEPLFPG